MAGDIAGAVAIGPDRTAGDPGYPCAVTVERGDARRVDALTGIRILAASGVFLSHVHAPELLPGPVRTFFAAGYNGVTLFFILSGFVLAWNYADRLSSPNRHALRDFAVARFARIYPLYLFALLVAIAPVLVNGGVQGDIWLHVFALQPWHPDVFTAFGYNGPAWSIGVEFFLYACFPLVAIGVSRLKASPRALLAVMVLAVMSVAAVTLWFSATGRGALPSTDPDSAHRWLYRMPLTRLGDFVLGAACALLVRSVPNVNRRLAVAAQLTGVALVVLMMSSPRMLSSVWSWDLAYMVPAALIIWGLASAPLSGLAKVLATRPFVLLGEASFAFYLLHALLLPRFEIAGADTLAGWAFVTALQYALIALVAIGAHVGVERPAQKWLRRTFSSRRSTSKAEPVSDASREKEPALT